MLIRRRLGGIAAPDDETLLSALARGLTMRNMIGEWFARQPEEVGIVSPSISKPRLWIGIGLVSAVVLTALITIFADNPHLLLALQTISGNWSPPSAPSKVTRAEFVISAILALMINWATLIGAFVLVSTYIKRLVNSEVSMASIKDVLDLDEEQLRLSLMKQFGSDEQTMSKIDEAFTQAAAERPIAIAKTFGKEAARRFQIAVEHNFG